MNSTNIKLIAALVLGAVALPTRAEVVVETFCLGSVGGKQARLEFRTYRDTDRGFTFAAIKYEKSTKTIPLVLRHSAASKISANTPYELTRVWLEIVDEKFTGEYSMTSQGATINSFTYLASSKSSPEFHFEPLPSVDIDAKSGCKW